MAAKSVNTRPIQGRLDVFERAHRTYVTAQDKVEAAEAALGAAQTKLLQRDRERDEAVELLARALIAEGQSRTKPFAGCGGPTPAAIKSLPAAQEAQQIHALVTALQRNPALTKATQQAMAAVDKAATAVEKALALISTLDATLSQARQARDALSQTWEKALAALKRGARAAVDEGAPHLYATLFGQTTRTGTRNGKHAPDPAPAPATVAAPVAPVASAG
jgi:DNA repair exonuclease SbcCD ATPase subunit